MVATTASSPSPKIEELCCDIWNLPRRIGVPKLASFAVAVERCSYEKTSSETILGNSHAPRKFHSSVRATTSISLKQLSKLTFKAVVDVGEEGRAKENMMQ